MYAQKLSFDYAHTLHTVRIVHNAHSVHRSRVQKGQSCDCINFVRATEPSCGTGNFLGLLPESMKNSRIYSVNWTASAAELQSSFIRKLTSAYRVLKTPTFPTAFLMLQSAMFRSDSLR